MPPRAAASGPTGGGRGAAARRALALAATAALALAALATAALGTTAFAATALAAALAAAAALTAAFAAAPAFAFGAILRGSAQKLGVTRAGNVVQGLKPLLDEVPNAVPRWLTGSEPPELFEQETTVTNLGERSAHRQLDEAPPASRFSATATQENRQRRTCHRRRRSTGTGGAPPGCLNLAEVL